MILETTDGPLYYAVTEATPPWIEQPETIVFCHGVATNSDVWFEWLSVLAPHYRIVRFDTRGFGRSCVPKEGYAWSMDTLADDILAVAKATQSGRFHLIAESAGGAASLRLASREDSPLLSLTCASTAHRGTDLPLVKDWRQSVLYKGAAAWSLEMMERRFYPDALTVPMWNWYNQTQSQTDPASFLDVGELLLRTDLSDQLPKINVPTLLLTPDASPFVSVALSDEIHRLVPHCDMMVFPHSKHGLPFSHGRQCAEAVRAFLASRE